MTWKKGPYYEDVKAGQTVAYCACGFSENPPHCDGSHSQFGLSPMIEKFNENKKVAFCGCRKSKNKPFCDGRHAYSEDE